MMPRVRRQLPRVLAFAALLALAAVSACSALQEKPWWKRGLVNGALPQPTENFLDDEDEESAQHGRAEWIERIHRAARGLDWRAIERANGEAEMARRNLLVASSPSFLVSNRWSEVGSRNQAGRIHCAALGSSISPVKLYAGSSNGGVWRGDAGGTNWKPLSDNLYGGAHELAVVPGEFAGDPDLMLATTDGGGVHVSRDDGLTWQTPAGLPALSSARAVGSLNDSAHTLLVYGQYNSGGTKPGIFASTDHGRTFANRWTGSLNFTGSMWVPRTGAGAVNKVYLLHRGQLFWSQNGGALFTAAALIDAAADKGVLCGSEAGVPTLYAALHAGSTWKLYRSDDAGLSFTFTYTITDFYESMVASTWDATRVMFGGLEVWRSVTSGLSFTKINAWGEYYGNPATKLHADCFGLHCWRDPSGAPGVELGYISTDGGLYKTTNWGATVSNLTLTGMGVSQYYSTLTSRTSPSLILAGAQDQGYQRGTFQPPIGGGGGGGGGPSTDFAQLISGDYGHLTSSDGSHALVYSTYPGFVLVQQGEANPQILYPFVDFPTGSGHDWLPAVVADPLDATKFYFCGDKLYLYTRVSGPTWSVSTPSTFNFLAGSASFLTAVAFAHSNAQRVYAVNDRGRLFTSTDHGINWVLSASTGPSPHYFYGHTLAVNPVNALEAAVGGSGYSTSGVRRTLDGGASWQALASGLPSTFVYGLAYALDGSGDIFAATESGAYQFVAASGAWQNIMDNHTPITTYWSVEMVDGGQKARFGTYGRGIWDFGLPPAPPGPLVPTRY